MGYSSLRSSKLLKKGVYGVFVASLLKIANNKGSLIKRADNRLSGVEFMMAFVGVNDPWNGVDEVTGSSPASIRRLSPNVDGVWGP